MGGRKEEGGLGKGGIKKESMKGSCLLSYQIEIRILRSIATCHLRKRELGLRQINYIILKYA